jgi:isoquinoline 1-oxidoreductase subunit beta
MQRREFLRVSATAAGGMMLWVACGSKKAKGKHEDEKAAAIAGEGAELNAWIRIDPDDTVTFRISDAEMGQGILTAVSMILAEELDADWSKVKADHAPGDSAKYGSQSTGGSTTIRQGWVPMREAGAKARAMLVAAAAARLGVAASELTTEASTIVHAASGRRLRYGEVVADAAKLTPPEKPEFKAPDRYHLVGKPTPRLDTRAKITGQAVYGLDVRLPGMLVAQVARAPMLGAKPAKIDDAAARTVPGVRDIVTITSGVAVIADHFWAAKKGREALVVEWEGGDAALDSAAVSKKLADAVGGGVDVRTAGDAAKTIAGAGAKRTLRASYEVPYLAHAPMEPLSATVHVHDGICEIWTGTQSPSFTAMRAATILAINPEKVKVTTTFLGGGFGRRSQTDFIADAVEVARAAKVPVKTVWTREDDVRGGQYRPAALSQIEGALDADGWPVAWVQRIASPSILASLGPLKKGVDKTSVEGVDNMPYSIPNVHVTYANPSLPVSTWFWRSVGSSQNAWAVECFLDELARLGGKDPLEVRRRLLADKPRHLAVLEAAVKAAAWGTPAPAGRARGLAVHESFGSFVAEVAEVSIESGMPRIHNVWCAIDCGRVVNPSTVRAQMESGIVYGLSAALHGAIGIDGGKIVTSNFHDYPVVRMSDMPVIDVILVESTADPGGVGEPGTPPIAPAVSNALFALTGKPVRRLPIRLTA